MFNEWKKIEAMTAELSDMLDDAYTSQEFFKLRKEVKIKLDKALEEATSGGLDENLTTGEYLRMKNYRDIAYRLITGTPYPETKPTPINRRPF